jgi:hypothetical protein
MDRRFAAAVLACGALVGCGLVSSDVFDFTLAFPKQEFAVNTASWGLPTTGKVPTVPCTMTSQCQSLARNATPNPMVCGSGGTCEAHVDITATVPYDLKSSNEFSQVNDKPLVTVRIDKIEYEVKEDTLTFATPPVGLYIAPANITDPAQAMQFGTIPAIAMGTKPGIYEVMISATGKQVIADTVKNYKVPFNILVKTASPMVFKAGDDVPQGALHVVVEVSAVASP